MSESSPHLLALPLTAGENTDLVSVGIGEHYPRDLSLTDVHLEWAAAHIDGSGATAPP
jgi:hypothetical protein